MRLLVINDDTAKVNLEKFPKMVDLFLAHGFTYFGISHIYLQQSDDILKRGIVACCMWENMCLEQQKDIY